MYVNLLEVTNEYRKIAINVGSKFLLRGHNLEYSFLSHFENSVNKISLSRYSRQSIHSGLIDLQVFLFNCIPEKFFLLDSSVLFVVNFKS